MLNLFINRHLYNIKSSHLSTSWKYFVLPLNSLSTLYLFKNHFLNYTHPIFQTWNLRVVPHSLFQPSPHPINHRVRSALPPKFHPLLPVPTTVTLVRAAIISGWGYHTGLQMTPQIHPGFQAIFYSAARKILLKAKLLMAVPRFKICSSSLWHLGVRKTSTLPSSLTLTFFNSFFLLCS